MANIAKKRTKVVSKLFSINQTWRKTKKAGQTAILISLLCCSFLCAVWILPAVSADRIAFNYGIFGEFYISIADLEIFATEGKITPSFAYYANRVSPENLAKLRDLLNRSFDINQVTASVFLKFPIGQQLIEEVSTIIDAPARVSQPALRAAIVLAAAKPEGLTILNVLRLYSTKTLTLNTEHISKAVDEATKILVDTERVFAALERTAMGAETDNTTDVSDLADLKQLGLQKWHQESLVIETSDRNTEGVVYLPLAENKPAPLVVIAPGLNTDWQSFTYLAKHLASYGFGVAAVNFPGSDAERVNAVLNGLDTPPSNNQWVEQPKVVTRLLDEIERKSKNDPLWEGKLNLQRVGIIGQSLGGYTAMAIAGAKIDWQHLQKECQKLENPERLNFNPALYWQCKGVGDSPPATDLQDQRIVAAIAVNPVTNPIFSKRGMSQMRSPLMIVTGDKDLFALALDEQIKPFTWLPDTDIDKYLVLVKNSTHFSFIGTEESEDIELSSQRVDSDSPQAYSYLKVLSVAFFKTYLAPQNEFKPYLTESYIKSISKQPLPINLLRSLDGERLEQLINQ